MYVYTYVCVALFFISLKGIEFKIFNSMQSKLFKNQRFHDRHFTITFKRKEHRTGIQKVICYKAHSFSSGLVHLQNKRHLQ